ncbi:MAG: hypothetical protein JOZ79_07560 [Sphingomonas sp.]|nr:hypothetical protein [Sphingomonas sp.]
MAVRSASERAIVISPEPFGAGFDVRVEPALPDGRHFGRELATIKAARGYAHELRDELRLGIVDQGDVG